MRVIRGEASADVVAEHHAATTPRIGTDDEDTFGLRFLAKLESENKRRAEASSLARHLRRIADPDASIEGALPWRVHLSLSEAVLLTSNHPLRSA